MYHVVSTMAKIRNMISICTTLGSVGWGLKIVVVFLLLGTFGNFMSVSCAFTTESTACSRVVYSTFHLDVYS